MYIIDYLIHRHCVALLYSNCICKGVLTPSSLPGEDQCIQNKSKLLTRQWIVAIF